MLKKSFFSAFTFRLSMLSLVVISGVRPAFCTETWILIPLQAGISAAANLNQILRHPKIISGESVFGHTEQKILSQMGEAELARALKITVRTAQDADKIRAWIEKKQIPVRLEKNPVAQGMQTDPLSVFQWGLDNRGLSQKLYIDDLTSLDIPGSSGEDVGIAGVLKSRGESENKIRVAVLDTGIDYGHPDLKGQILRKPEECAALKQYQDCLTKEGSASCDPKFLNIDSDKNGYPLDCSGWNLTVGKNKVTGIYGDPNATDEIGHGTHVAGIIGAAWNNIGVRGVISQVEIIPVKIIRASPNQPIRPQGLSAERVLSSELPPVPMPDERELHWGTSFGDVLARGMLYAIQNKAHVINLSLAWPAAADSELMKKMVALAQARGALVVAAAGNDSSDTRVYPCLYPRVVCVAAHNPDGAISHFSNYGSFVDVAAPGLGILSTWPLSKRASVFTAYDGYEIKNGTSMATPFVSGLLARLLSLGYSVEESYARLLAGARLKDSPKKYIRSGNVDLSRSLGALEQPLILQSKKEVLKPSWDGIASFISFSVPLTNFWTKAAETVISLRVLKEDGKEAGAQILPREWKFSEWHANEQKILSVVLQFLDLRDVEGRLWVELTVKLEQQRSSAPRTILIPLEIATTIDTAHLPAHAQIFEVRGPSRIPPAATLRTVTALDGDSSQDYFTFEERGPNWRLQLLKDKKDHYEVGAIAQVPAVVGDLLLVQRLDIDQDGSGDYVFIFRIPPVKGEQVSRFRFQYFDQKLQPLSAVQADGSGVVEYDNKISVLSENFQWMRVNHNVKTLLVPAWIALGLTPSAEMPALDPWESMPENSVAIRLYYLLPDGIRSVSTNQEFAFIQLLKTGASEMGRLTALTAQGGDYELEYRLAQVEDGKVLGLRSLALERYRMLAGLDGLLKAMTLNPIINDWVGSVLSGSGVRGHLRATTFLFFGAAQNSSPSILDFVVSPPGFTESVMQLVGVYAGKRRFGVFSQLHYELQYDERVRDDDSFSTVRTALNRFSFLPAFISNRALYPVTVHDTQVHEDELLPGVLVPAEFGNSGVSEIVIPSYAKDEQLIGLSRPAQWRLSPGSGCTLLGNPIEASQNLPTQLVLFCKDRFLRIPLTR
jgi:subtilisin family serine protease